MSWRYRVDGGREQQTLSCVICVTSDFAWRLATVAFFPVVNDHQTTVNWSRRSREDAQVINCNSSMLPRERYRLAIFCLTRVTAELREHSRSHHRFELAFLCFFCDAKVTATGEKVQSKDLLHSVSRLLCLNKLLLSSFSRPVARAH